MVNNFESAKTVSEKKEIMLKVMADFMKSNWGKYKDINPTYKIKAAFKELEALEDLSWSEARQFIP
jgi:hypothetical protein